MNRVGNSVVILGRKISIRPNGADHPGRTVAYRSLPAEATSGKGGAYAGGGTHRDMPPDKAIPGDAMQLPILGNSYPDVAPASRRIIDRHQISGRLSSGGALPGFPTTLDTGLPPQRIRRRTQAADRGAVAPGTGTRVTGALGYNAGTNGGSQTIPHIRIPRTPITVTAFRRTIDFTSSIPSRGIGAPVR